MPESLKKLINLIWFLPWIWEKSATKLAFFLLNSNKNFLQNLSSSLNEIQSSVKKCDMCWSLVDKNIDLCHICKSQSRKDDLICVVEEYLDMLTIENSQIFDWKYHILWWAISPINWVFIWDLNFALRDLNVLNCVTLTRLSRWLSSWYLEYADNITLINSIKERKEI